MTFIIKAMFEIMLPAVAGAGDTDNNQERLPVAYSL